MDSFDSIMKAACHIKSYQLSFDKKIFDNLPEFYKTGLYYCDQMKEVHNQKDYLLKREAFELHREKGILQISNKDYEEAEYSFCKALCIFKYIKNKNPNWKNEGVKDEELEFIEEHGESPNETEDIKRLKISALLNIALCNLQLEKFLEVREACDEVIKLDPRNIKAYYRKAKSFLDCKSSTLDDYILALKEIEKAREYHLDNKEIFEIYENLSNLVNKQKSDEKKIFKSFFRNVNYRYEENQIKTKENQAVENNFLGNNSKFLTQVTDDDAKSGKPEIRILNLLIEQSYVLSERCEREGDRVEMKKLKNIAEKSKAYKNELQSLLELNFENPNEELKSFAKSNHLDLNEPNVKNEFIKRRKQYLQEINKFYEENILKKSEIRHNKKTVLNKRFKDNNTILNREINATDDINSIGRDSIAEANINEPKKKLLQTDIKRKKINFEIITAFLLFVGIVYYFLFKYK